MSRIRWSNEEVKTVAQIAAANLARSRGPNDLFGAADAFTRPIMEDALFAAQKALPAPRRKSYFNGLYQTLQRQVRSNLRQIAKQPSPVPFTPSPAPTPPLPDIQIAASLRGAIADGVQLAARAYPEETAALFEEIFGTGGRAPAPAQPHHRHNPNPATNGKRKTRVAVIGLLNEQRKMIQRELPFLDLRFVNSTESGRRVAVITRMCDAAVVMTKFVSHSTCKLLKTEPIRVNGGMSELARVLTDRYGPERLAA